MERIERPAVEYERLPDPRRLPTRASAEFMAEAFLRGHGVEGPPVDIRALAPMVSIISVTEDDISKAAILMVIPDVGFAVILRRRDGAQRKRFSMAHEIGHRVLHPAYVSIHELTQVAARSDYDRLERTVNHFAACLLMPRGWFTERLKAGLSNEQLARQFDVSHTAAEARRRELGHIERRAQ